RRMPASRRVGTVAHAVPQCAGRATAPPWSSDAMTFRLPGETRQPRGYRAVPCRVAWKWISLYMKDEQSTNGITLPEVLGRCRGRAQLHLLAFKSRSRAATLSCHRTNSLGGSAS